MDRRALAARLSPGLFAAIGYFLPRLLFLPARHGARIGWGDIARALRDFPEVSLDVAAGEFWRIWMERWTALGDEHCRAADAAVSDATARMHNRAAAACFHWGEFMYFADAEAKGALRDRIRARWRASVDPAALALTEGSFAWRGATVPWYLLRPGPGSRPAPCMILSNGLDSVTEVEMVALAEPLLERGIAVLLFDGPGQGVNLGRHPLPEHPEQMAKPLLALLAGLPAIDTGRIGFLGISFGGMIALRVAASMGGRFRCVVNLSGGPRLSPFETLPRRLKPDFAFAFGEDDPAAMQRRFDALAIPPGSAGGTHVLSVHGALDDIFPIAPLRALDADWGALHRLETYETEAHACLNHIGDYAADAADWVAARLSRRDRPVAPTRPLQQEELR